MDSNPHISINFLQCQQLQTYLESNQIDCSLMNLSDTVLHLLQQKDEQIKVLSGQITKYKAEQIKNNKIVTQLQQKINKISPNTNNTSSSFMMASEFKDFFDDFMKNTLPACVSPLIPFPKACSEYVSHLLSTVYNQIQQRISKKTQKICQILCLECSSQNSMRIRSCLLKTMQDNWQSILQFHNQSQTPSLYIQKALIFSNEQIQEIIQSEQFIELDKKMIKICAYMILQQQKWKFLTFEHRVELFTKKEHNFIDGWIKEQDEVIFVVEGISKINEEGNLLVHPNLRNYVIPYFQENYIFKENSLRAQMERKEAKFIDQQCQCSPKIQRKQLDQFNFGELNKENEAPKNNQELENKLKKNSSCSNLPKKYTVSQQKEFSEKADQKVSTEVRKLSKGSNKMSTIIQVDSVSILLSPHLPKGSKHSNNTLKIGNCEIVENQPIVQNYSNLTKSSKLKSSKNNHNLISDPSFEDFVPMPHKKRDYVDQLPLKRDTSRNKKCSSRKASAGKIVGQMIEQKENRVNKENIVKQKQKDNKQSMSKDLLYKDIIKQKLGSDYRTEREKQKQSKIKDREQDRPLRLNIKKLRQKVNF